jgi:hypothetical protein
MTTKRKRGNLKPGKQQGGGRKPRLTKAEREDLELAEEILRVGREDQAAFAAGFKKFLKQLGIKGKPIGAKKLREMAIKEGLNPKDNQFSRGIIEMREE